MSNKQNDAFYEMQNEIKQGAYCQHICTSDCRRNGCNCDCGEWHEQNEPSDRIKQEIEKDMQFAIHQAKMFKMISEDIFKAIGI